MKGGFGQLVSLKDALEMAKVNVGFVEDETVPLEEALGRVLAEDIVAPIDVPGFHRAAMDGYAVRAEDTFEASETSPITLKLVGSVCAGEVWKGKLEGGSVVRISTGAPMPAGSDAVVMVEHTEEKEGSVFVYRSVSPGSNVIKKGSDVKRGERVLEKGILLKPRHTGVLSALGITHVKVVRKPKVAVISTGKEIAQPGEKLLEGMVYDINSRTIVDALRNVGCEPIWMGCAKDEEELVEFLKKSKGFDLMITSGGSSLGGEDRMADLVKREGELLVHGIAVKPGKPVVMGRIHGNLLIGLPGYPMSALSDLYVIVYDVIRHIMRVRKPIQRKILARMERKVVSSVGRYQFLPVALVKDGEGYAARPIMKGSNAITSLSSADGFVEIPENKEIVEAGEMVEVVLFE